MEVDFVSVWNDGVGIETKAMYNAETNVVYDIETTDEGIEDLDILECEYIILPDGAELSVSNESGEYKVIDFVKILRESMCEEEEIADGEDYPIFDDVLIEYANGYDVILGTSDIEEISSSMDVDADGYPYILKKFKLSKYNVTLSISAYHRNGWDFYIENIY